MLNLRVANALTPVEAAYNVEMKVIVLVVAMAMCGCAVLFQERLPSDYAGNTEPRCATVHGWYLWDALNAAALTVFAAADTDANDERGAAVVAAGIHVVSAIYGLKWRGDCVDAITARDDQTLQPQQVMIVREHKATTTRGFFCATTSRGWSVCRRDELECDRARDALLVADPNVGDCSALPSVWCDGEGDKQCAPSKQQCEATGTADAPARCTQRR